MQSIKASAIDQRIIVTIDQMFRYIENGVQTLWILQFLPV